MSNYERAEPLKRKSIADGLYVSKLDDGVIAKIVQALRAGATPTTAADFAGISRPTYGRWLREGRNGIELGSDDPELQPKIELVRAIDKALADLKILLAGRIQQAGEGEGAQWTANAWVLERRFPDEYGRRQRIDHGNADGAPLMLSAVPSLDLSKLSDQELAEFIRLGEKARPSDALGAAESRSEPLLLDAHPIIEAKPVASSEELSEQS